MIAYCNSVIINLTNDWWLQINEDCSWNVLAAPGLTEEGAEGVVDSSDGLVWGHGTIWGDSVFQTVQLPAGVAHLDTSLTNVHADTFTLKIEMMR